MRGEEQTPPPPIGSPTFPFFSSSFLFLPYLFPPVQPSSPSITGPALLQPLATTGPALPQPLATDCAPCPTFSHHRLCSLSNHHPQPCLCPSQPPPAFSSLSVPTHHHYRCCSSVQQPAPLARSTNNRLTRQLLLPATIITGHHHQQPLSSSFSTALLLCFCLCLAITGSASFFSLFLLPSPRLCFSLPPLSRLSTHHRLCFCLCPALSLSSRWPFSAFSAPCQAVLPSPAASVPSLPDHHLRSGSPCFLF